MNEQRRTIQIALTALVFLVWMQILPQLTQANQVDIPDPNLLAAVRDALNLLGDEPVTEQKMRRLTDLGVSDLGITNLTGLEYARNLTYLGIAYNQITDLTPIAGLTQLNTLYMWATSVSDLAPLANLTNLRVLLASYCDGIADISPLANLTQLETINLSGNKIIDIAPLAHLKRLTHLQLVSNQITDVSPLAGLTQLRVLEIQENQIVEHSPLDALSLEHFTYDQTCDMPPSPLQPRLDNRSFPSVASAWGRTTSNQPHLSYMEMMSQHDLYFCCLSMFGQELVNTGEGWVVRGTLDEAIKRRDDFLAHNPNMIFLAVINAVWEDYDTFPEDSPYWQRDAQGQILSAFGPSFGAGIVNLNHPDVQQRIIERAVGVSKCGLYDGIIFDGWNEWHTGRRNHHPGVEAILRGIREGVRPDFLIGVNPNRDKTPISMPYINGLFFEPGILDPINYPRGDGDIEREIEKLLSELEETLSWAESNLRSPQVNLLEIAGLEREPADSPANLRWMRAMTALGLTFSNGYILYTVYDDSRHFWYDFWDANLGRPIGPKLQLYQETDGLYIREFTNGWAVYNHSGEPQIITLAETVQAVASGLVNTEHALPNLNGEIYLRTRNPADVNGDGTIDIRDLVLVSQGMGTDQPDVNGDGAVNIFDLIVIAQHLNQK